MMALYCSIILVVASDPSATMSTDTDTRLVPQDRTPELMADPDYPHDVVPETPPPTTEGGHHGAHPASYRIWVYLGSWVAFVAVVYAVARRSKE